jgi:hypothetical protein
MPNRILRDWTDSELINELSWQAEVLFTRLIMKADDFGRFSANEKLIRSLCFPLKDGVRDADITRWLAECEQAGLIVVYHVNSKAVLAIRNFGQRLRQKRELYPPPPDDGQLADNCQANDGQMTAGNEEKRNEEKREDEVAKPGAVSPPGKSDLQKRIEHLLRRRESVPWDVKELKVFAANRKAIEATTEEDWQKLEYFYSLPQAETFSRKNLESLLSHWNGEVDKAVSFRKQTLSERKGAGYVAPRRKLSELGD